MKRSETVLIVENEANMRRVLSALLHRDGYPTLEASDGGQAILALERERIDVVLTDLKMPHMNGIELLEQVRKRFRGIPVILLTAHGTIGSAVEALKHGAFDYLTKPFDPDEIRMVVSKAARTRKLQEAEPILDPEEDPEGLLLGESDALCYVKRLIERVAPTTATVLISGESGTGKELVARSLHLRSERRDLPFVKINCAAIPENLLESELFGHEKGAFTGAAARKPGRFELADTGTLFLDEIGEMPLPAQPKLLRALQDGCFYRVGATRTVTVDVRLIAATNRDLRDAVRVGRFREDLFYRLHVFPIRIPPLRERRQDIPVLAQCFVERAALRLKRPVVGMEPELLDALVAHSWPGNIRELENVIERAVLLADGRMLKHRDLPAELLRELPGAESARLSAPLRERVRAATRRIEREAIIEALQLTNGNVTKAARRLGISRRGLQLKIREGKARERGISVDIPSECNTASGDGSALRMVGYSWDGTLACSAPYDASFSLSFRLTISGTNSLTSAPKRTISRRRDELT
jgi:DNA-binding NtrC family response regulator